MIKQLYHGSDKIIQKPPYHGGKAYDDYGYGFYCTEVLEMAKEWSVDKDHDGYANCYDLDAFWKLFLSSGMAERFGSGDFTLLVGKSGVEIAWAVLEKSGVCMERVNPRYTRNRSEEYWAGWALAWYQWECAVPFEEITSRVPITEIKQMYFPYHEMDIRQFADKIDEKCRAVQRVTRLKQLRMQSGYTQQKLAELTDVPLQTLQQYERRIKDINKARVDYVVRIAYVLGCRVQDLLEYFE